MEDNMKYISIIIMSLFLVGNAYSKSASTIWKKVRVIVQGNNPRGVSALIEHRGELYYCFANTEVLRCSFISK